MGVKVDTRQLEKFSKDIARLSTQQADEFMEFALRQTAIGFLGAVIEATPVGDSRKNKDGETIHVGGSLRRAWTCNTEAQAEAGMQQDSAMYIAGRKLEERKRGGHYSMTLKNPMHYASYVEYGHKQKPGRFVPAIGKRLVNRFVEGVHFVKETEEDFREAAPAELQRMLDDYLKKVF
ncbi:MAG: HK97 gp10 family phage protein [Clostridia bacterium]|nr:HK97 gp10 family phage protein [Clostridia bacterium]